MSVSDWSVCESDDEWNQYNAPAGTDIKSEPYMPQRLAMLFKEIQQKKILPLTCSCQRVGSNKESKVTKIDAATNQESPNLDKNQVIIPEGKHESETKETAADTSKGYEAFEFDEDNNDRGPASAKRKTPAGVKRAKKDKVGSLTNVVNDIRRQKLLDEMEAKDKDNTSTETTFPK